MPSVAGLTYLACGCFLNGAGRVVKASGTAAPGWLFDESVPDGLRTVTSTVRPEP